MKYFLLCIFFIGHLNLFGQKKTGVDIQRTLSWEQIKEKAKQEKKYILLDCNSSWCGPCKYLENRIFPMDTIGKLLNPKFIVVSIQFDTADADDVYTKTWYGTAQQFKKEFRIFNFPTEIILDTDARPLSKFVGINTDDGVFDLYRQINNALDSNFQFYSLKRKYFSEAIPDMDVMAKLVSASMNAGEYELMDSVYKNYLRMLHSEQFYTKENCEFVANNLHSTTDSMFLFVYNNYVKIDSIIGQALAKDRLGGLIYDKYLFYKVFHNAGSISEHHYVYVEEPNWDTIKNSIKNKYPKLANDIVLYAKFQYYSLERLWDKYFSLLHTQLAQNNILAQYSVFEISQFATNILRHSEDRKLIDHAVDWLSVLRMKYPNDAKIHELYSAFQHKTNSNLSD